MRQLAPHDWLTEDVTEGGRSAGHRQLHQCSQCHGPLENGVNNAGVGGRAAKVGELSDKDRDKVITVNLNAVFLGTRVQAVAMSDNVPLCSVSSNFQFRNVIKRAVTDHCE